MQRSEMLNIVLDNNRLDFVQSTLYVHYVHICSVVISSNLSESLLTWVVLSKFLHLQKQPVYSSAEGMVVWFRL